MKWKWVLAAILAVGVFGLVPRAQQRGKVALIRVPNGGIQPQAVVAGTTLHLLYFAGDPKAGDLFYVKSADYGGKWSAPLRVNSETGTALAIGTIRGGQLAIGKNGRIHVAWNGSSVAESKGPMNPEAGRRGAPMLYTRLNDAGTGFEPERNLMMRTFGLDGGGTLGADSMGNVYVGWHGKTAGAGSGEAGRQVWVATSRDDGKTFAAEQTAWDQPTGACGCCGMAMFADSKGSLRALYRSATEDVHRDMYLLESLDQARSFTGRKLATWDINACPMSSMSVAEGAGKVMGAWETAGQVYLQDLGNSGSQAVTPAGNGVGRKHPRIAIAPSGQMLMVWTDGTGWQRGGSLAWQEFDGNGKSLSERGTTPGVATWSFGAVVAGPGGFVVVY